MIRLSIRTLLAFSWLGTPLALRPQGIERPTPATVIRDNSFLIEEAYNQEGGVVQHINTFSRDVYGTAWAFTFTQEWPVGGQIHQLSYAIPVEHRAVEGNAQTGLGDVAINYRYQLIGETGPVAFAPRFTIGLPTGSSRNGFGSGGATVQVNLPLSVTLPESFVAHTNVGLSFTPRARNSTNAAASTREYSLGQSVVWLLHPRVNVLLESRWTAAEEVSGPGQTESVREFLVAPGIRAAIDFASGLQIVPGVAVPFGVGPSRGERSVFLYLSFEHPFGKTAH